MKACVLRAAAKVETNPLEFAEVAVPEPGEGEVRVRVHACGVCRTDLHVIEGELLPRMSPVDRRAAGALAVTALGLLSLGAALGALNADVQQIVAAHRWGQGWQLLLAEESAVWRERLRRH